jgi:hypothetical protein
MFETLSVKMAPRSSFAFRSWHGGRDRHIHGQQDEAAWGDGLRYMPFSTKGRHALAGFDAN